MIRVYGFTLLELVEIVLVVFLYVLVAYLYCGNNLIACVVYKKVFAELCKFSLELRLCFEKVTSCIKEQEL